MTRAVAALSFALSCGWVASAQERFAIVVDPAPESRVALAIAVELLRVGDELSVVAADGTSLLPATRIPRRSLLADRRKLVRRALSRLDETEAAGISDGLSAARRISPQVDRVVLLCGAWDGPGRGAELLRSWPSPASPGALLGTRLDLLIPSPTEPELLDALAAVEAQAEDSRGLSPQVVGRVLGGWWYRTRRGVLPVPPGSSQLIAFLPPGEGRAFVLDGRPVDGEEAELEGGWSSLRVRDPAPGYYELEGVPPGQRAVILARLPWSPVAAVLGERVLQISLVHPPEHAPEVTGDAQVVVTQEVEGRVRAIPVTPREPRRGLAAGDESRRWEGTLLPSDRGTVIVDLELLATDLDPPRTGWRFRRALPFSGGDPGEARLEPRVEEPPRRLDPEPPEPEPLATFRLEPQELDAGQVAPGAATQVVQLWPSWSDDGAVVLQRLDVALYDEAGRKADVRLQPGHSLPRRLDPGAPATARIVLPNYADHGVLRGSLVVGVQGAPDQRVPLTLEVVPPRISFAEPRVSLAISREQLPFERTITVELGADVPRAIALELEVLPGRSTPQFAVELRPARVTLAPVRGERAVARVDLIVRAERPEVGAHELRVLARPPKGEATELVVELIVEDAPLALSHAELLLEPVRGAEGMLLAAALEVEGSAVEGSNVEKAELAATAQLDETGWGVEAACRVRGRRIELLVYRPDDVVGTPLSGVLVVEARVSGGEPRSFRVPFTVAEK